MELDSQGITGLGLFVFGTPLLACSFQDRVYVSCEAEYFIYSSAVKVLKDLVYATLL